MKTRIELNERDIAAAIAAHVLAQMGMRTSGPVTLTSSPDDRNGPVVFSASVMAEPVTKVAP